MLNLSLNVKITSIICEIFPIYVKKWIRISRNLSHITESILTFRGTFKINSATEISILPGIESYLLVLIEQILMSVMVGVLDINVHLVQSV